jgi:SAM-dependent MidA family methyltransferase
VSDPRPFDVGLRRVPELETADALPEADPELTARITDEIRTRGPMTFARFMELALYDPEHGYYATSGGPGRERDFLTAPESHPIFGWALARRIEQVWTTVDRPERFVVREHGAGRGALAVAILDGLRRSGSPVLGAIRYQAFERSAAAAPAFQRAIADAGLEAFVEPPTPEPEDGIVLANELLDALPVHRVEGQPGGALAERIVALEPRHDPEADGATSGSGFVEVLGDPSTPELARRLASEDILLRPGQVAEICLEIDPWLASAVAPLRRGLAILIDYGAPAAELYAANRGSTLRAYSRHRVHADPFAAIGRQDLTAHVDLTAVERAAAANGLTVVRRARQAEYLAELGLGELLVGLQSGPEADLGRYLEARSAVVRLLDPRATGGFAVLELARDLLR